MPYLTTETYIDKNGRTKPKGITEKIDLITNSLAIINRTIPMAIFEASLTFIMDKTRKHMATLNNIDEQSEFLFDVLTILNPSQGKDMKILYDSFNDREKKAFIADCISLDSEGRLRTDNGIYLRWDSFNTEFILRDAIIKIYEKYKDIITPYHIFVPKPKWGRDIYLGTDYIGYQYILKLKQSGERGFSVRSAGSINDESLPEKSNENKIGRLWHSETPIRFGEYETPGIYWAYFLNCGNILLGQYYQTSIVIY